MMKAVQALKNPLIHVCILIFSKLCVCGLYSPIPYHIVVDDAYSFLFVCRRVWQKEATIMVTIIRAVEKMVIIMGIVVVDVLTLSLVTIMAITTQAAEKMVRCFYYMYYHRCMHY